MSPWRAAQARASQSTLLGLRLLGEPHVPSARIMSRFNAPLSLDLVAGLALERDVAVFSCLWWITERVSNDMSHPAPGERNSAPEYERAGPGDTQRQGCRGWLCLSQLEFPKSPVQQGHIDARKTQKQ